MNEKALSEFLTFIDGKLGSVPIGVAHTFSRSCLKEARDLVAKAICDRRNAGKDRSAIERDLARAMILAGEAGVFGERDGP